MAENLFPTLTANTSFQPVSSQVSPETMTLEQLDRFMGSPEFLHLPTRRQLEINFLRRQARERALEENTRRQTEQSRESAEEFPQRSPQELERRAAERAGVIPPQRMQ